MLETEFGNERGCISCGDRDHRTVKVKINGDKYDDNIITFHLCKKCLNKLAREFYPFS